MLLAIALVMFNPQEWSTEELKQIIAELAKGEALDLAAGDRVTFYDRRAQRNACEAELSKRKES